MDEMPQKEGLVGRNTPNFPWNVTLVPQIGEFA